MSGMTKIHLVGFESTASVYANNVSVQQIMSHLHRNNSKLHPPSIAGLYLPQANKWLEPTQTLGEQGVTSEEVIEYRARPRACTIKVLNKQTLEFELDPLIRVSAVVSFLLAENKIDSDERFYGLYVPSEDTETPGTWMGSDQLLFAYRHTNQIIEFRERSTDILVVFPDKSRKIFSFVLNTTVETAFNTVTAEAQLPEKDSYQLSVVARVGQGGVKQKWLNDPALLLSALQIRTGDYILLHHKPQPYKIRLVLEEEVEVDIDSPLAKIMPMLCQKFNSMLNHPYQWALYPPRELQNATLQVPLGQSALGEEGPFGEQLNSDSGLASQAGLFPAAEDAGACGPLYLSKKHGGALTNLKHLAEAGENVDSGEGVELPDVPFWDEPNESSANLIWGEDKDGKRIVQAASLNILIGRLTHPDQHDLVFFKTFLLTYHSFTEPRKLLHKLFERFRVPRALDQGEEEYAKMCSIVTLRVGNALKQWMDQFWDDFDADMLAELRTFLTGEFRDSNPGLSQQLLKFIEKKSKGHSLTLTKSFSTVAPPPNLPDSFNVNSPDFTPLILTQEEVARQLTLCAFETYQSIRAPELLNQAWSKPKTQHRSPNVLALIDDFNKISNWVTHEIVRVEKLKERAKVFEWFIVLVQELRTLQNYSTLTAVLAGLNNSSTLRLKWTRGECPKKLIEALTEAEQLMSAEGSYREFRNIMRTLSPPSIPYIGVFLSDLTFIGDGNPDKIMSEKGSLLINFAKRHLEYTVISQLKQFQQTSYNLVPVPVLITGINEYITKMNADVTDASLYKLSLEREPRGATKQQLS